MISLPWNLRKGIEPLLRGLKGLRGRAVGGPGLGELLVLLVLLLGGLGHVLVEVLAALHNLDFLREGGKVGHAVPKAAHARRVELARLAQDGREDVVPEDNLVRGLGREAHGEREGPERIPVELDELVEVP